METNRSLDRGFTLIELLMVIVIVGLLAALAGPQFSLARERTYVRVMSKDLRNFATAQESYFYDFATYASDATSVQDRGFDSSEDVTLAVNEATSSGWSATAAHGGTGQQCYLYLGSAAPIGSARAEGVVGCS